MSNRTAIVFGATGLVGKSLVEELIKNMGYTAIKIFTRKKLGIEHIKIIEHIVDLENVESYSQEMRGNDLFICIGTTMKQAKSIKRYEEIDRDLPFNIASTAKLKGLERVAVVSAIGANVESKNYYNRIKGEMEAMIMGLNFERTVIARPSLLLGKRDGFRLMEGLGRLFSRLFSFILVGKLRIFRPIYGRDVAIAMIKTIAEASDRKIYLSDELQQISDRNNQ